MIRGVPEQKKRALEYRGKIRAIRRSRASLSHDALRYCPIVDENDDGSGNTVFIYYSSYGGSGLSSFEWPWDPATFDSAAYERFFSGKQMEER